MRPDHSLIASSASAVMATDDNGDSVHQFLMECHGMSTEAQFIVYSLPNAETPAVERPTGEFPIHPPLPARAHIPREHNSGQGCPAYVLDLERTILLHDLGISGDHVARAMGVVSATMDNHLNKAGLSSARKEWSLLTDTELHQVMIAAYTAQTDAFKFGEQSSRPFFMAGLFRVFFMWTSPQSGKDKPSGRDIEGGGWKN
ncbi:hypothetical protein FB451DRAFT_1178687 [Mycena latifolia]|nr:hypothetical protein FB451DRAFT_1178687 [Mycena latifolia]